MSILNSDSLYMMFCHVVRFHHIRMQKMLDKVGLYPGQPPMLFVLYHKDGQNQKELAKKLHIKPATATVMLGRMEKSGLIERKQDPEDQRVSRVYITDKGIEICKKSEEIMMQLDTEMFSNFSEEEKIILRRLFIQMKENLINGSDEKLEFKCSDD